MRAMQFTSDFNRFFFATFPIEMKMCKFHFALRSVGTGQAGSCQATDSPLSCPASPGFKSVLISIFSEDLKVLACGNDVLIEMYARRRPR